MKLWTVLGPARWGVLKRDGVLIQTSLDGVEEAFLAAYRWMFKQMATRIGPPPVGCVSPLWAWASRKPDMRRKEHKGPVRLTLEIPDAAIVLSDFGAWHQVLNKSPVTLNEYEDRAFEIEDDRYGGKDKRPAEFVSRIESTWCRIFDLDRTGADPEWVGKKEDMQIQATFWSITRDQIVKVEDFNRSR